MAAYALTDVAHDRWVENWELHSKDLKFASPRPWSVTKRVLHGGRREGVDLIEVDNGAISVAIVPTRGMGLWKGQCQGDSLGWQSPVADGPVNPAFVNLPGSGGLGWLDGFDELMVRCGLDNNGAPYVENNAQVGLHGKIANIPASFVSVQVNEAPPHEITVAGHVVESRLFGPRTRMVSKLTTTPGSRQFTVSDEFINLKDSPSELQVLYHWNFGPPYLEEGSRLVAPIKTVVPRDARAAESLDHYESYGKPQPGFAEQVYFMELLADPATGQTVALLRNRAGDKGVALRFPKSQLPCFTLWKSTGGLGEGYVTGLEPGTNYPNPKPFEKAHNRVVTLPVGGRYRTETTFEVLSSPEAVESVEKEVLRLQAQEAVQIHPEPVEPFAPKS